jgi:amidase
VVVSCLARLDAVNPKINAVVVRLGESALAEAEAADTAVARGDVLGPMHGVPVTIKINVDQIGQATSNGVVGFKGVIAIEDSPVVANFRAAGAIILGRMNTPAFSASWFTDSDLYGRTLNPWSKDHTPGGSSGGASASVAAGITRSVTVTTWPARFVIRPIVRAWLACAPASGGFPPSFHRRNRNAEYPDN